MRSKKYREIDNPDVFRATITEAGMPEGVSVDIADAEKESGKSILLGWVKEIIIAIIIAIIVMQFIKPTIVKQRSMEPNFHTNDYLLVSKQSYKLFHQNPEMGDVIIFETEMKTENGDDKLLIKRVIGVPGDVISIKDGKVYVNGIEIDDSYTNDGTTNGEIEDLVVPEGKVFCLGDNRLVSVDSRSSDIGFVDYSQIIGKAVFRLFPIKDFGTIYNPYK